MQPDETQSGNAAKRHEHDNQTEWLRCRECQGLDVPGAYDGLNRAQFEALTTNQKRRKRSEHRIIRFVSLARWNRRVGGHFFWRVAWMDSRHA